MRRCGFQFLLLSLVISWFVTPVGADAPSFRAFWADVFHTGYKSSAQIDTMVAAAAQGHFNAIIVEVLAYVDTTGGGHGAYWNSSLVPKALDIQGGIDPLAVLCQKAHAQNIEVHAWIYPFRCSNSWPPAGNTRVPSNGDWLMVNQATMGTGANPLTGTKYWLDFGNPDCHEYVVSIVKELVTNYPIDGLHFDYEFSGGEEQGGYPANVNAYTNAKSGLSRYKRIYNTTATPPTTGTGSANWSDMRRRFGDELMKRCRAEIPAIRTNPRQPVRFTASLMAYGSASGSCDFSSTTSYAYFSDWAKWLAQGWLDAAIPMNYKVLPCNESQYEGWINRSMSCWRQNRHVFVGLGIYLNSFADTVTQMSYAGSKGIDGYVVYSYAVTRASAQPTSGNCAPGSSADPSWYSYVAANFFPGVAATPAMPWRSPATAVEGTVWGRITDAALAPVDDASVLVNGQTVKTDGNGYYVITMIPAVAAGTNYALIATQSGLSPAGSPALTVLAGDVARYDFQLGRPPAQIVLSASALVREVMVDAALPPDTFTVSNAAGTALLNYTVTDNAPWLTVSPAGGINNGPAQTITISYQLGGLIAGTYHGLITVADPAAANSPRTVDVALTVIAGVPGDFDGDGDVDLEDFGRFQACLGGSGNGILAGCERANFDGDTDVDQHDLLKFRACLSGPNVPGDKHCAD